jgi:hypothetical protein
MTRHEAVVYLCAESRSLADESRDLRHELEVLRKTPFARHAWAMHLGRLQAFRRLVTNHCLAFKWTIGPERLI